MSTEPIQTKSSRSESIGQLAEALSQAQGEMTGATKDSENPYFKSKYADLASVWDACRKPLSTHKLAVVQMPVQPTKYGDAAIETTLMHASGEWMSGVMELTPVKQDPQGVGSCMTYIRRYALSAVAGIAPEDDDGNAASGKQAGQQKMGTVRSFGAKPDGGGGMESKGSAPLAAETTLVEQLEESVEALASTDGMVYITVPQAKNFHKECRAAVRPARSLEADDLIYKWLGDNGYNDKDGLPSASMIPATGWLTVRNKAIAWLKSQ